MEGRHDVWQPMHGVVYIYMLAWINDDGQCGKK